MINKANKANLILIWSFRHFTAHTLKKSSNHKKQQNAKAKIKH